MHYVLEVLASSVLRFRNAVQPPTPQAFILFS